jgi:hypothetical protein
MTEAYIVHRFFRAYGNDVKYLVNNMHFYQWEADIMALSKSDFLWEFEIKVSRADLQNDRQKIFRQVSKYDHLLNGNGPNRFYYLMPRDLADKCMDIIPEWAGILVVTNHGVLKIREARQLHKTKATDKDTLKILRAAYYKHFHKIRTNNPMP